LGTVPITFTVNEKQGEINACDICDAIKFAAADLYLK
jgi:hypothetical protein